MQREPLDVVIAGAGPGGLAAACLLSGAGASVIVLEQGTGHNEARRTSVLLQPGAIDLLRMLGADELVDEALVPIENDSARIPRRLVSLRRVDEALRALAVDHGVEIHLGVRVHQAAVDTEGLLGPDGSEGDPPSPVLVLADDLQDQQRYLLTCDVFIDATGGNTVLARLPRFQRMPSLGRTGAVTDPRRTYLAMHVPVLEGRGPSIVDPGSGAFLVNDVQEQLASVYVPIDPDEFDRFAGSAQVREATLRSALSAMDVDAPDHVDGAVIPAVQSVAPHATSEDGRIVLVGNSVGTVLPPTQMGVTLALMDGERAANAIIEAWQSANGDGIDGPLAAAMADYSATTVFSHRLHLL